MLRKVTFPLKYDNEVTFLSLLSSFVSYYPLGCVASIALVFLSNYIPASLFYQVLENLPKTSRINIAAPFLLEVIVPQSGATVNQISLGFYF